MNQYMPDPVLERNRRNVLEFYDTALNKKRPAEAIEKYAGAEYRQHNPRVPDGLSGIEEGIGKMERQIIPLKYLRLHRIIAEGNFVQTQSEGEYGGHTTAIMDLFRVENGKIAEHWDVIWEELPEKIAHNNGLF